MLSRKPAYKKIGLLMGILGLALTIGGWSIYTTQNDSLYFLVVGILILISGVLISAGKKIGAFFYLMTFLLMLVWSINEEGFDLEKLFPRLGMALIILVYLFMSSVYKELE